MARLRKINKSNPVITGYDWALWGFMPEEIKQFQYITWDGIDRPYFRSFINHRSSLKANYMRWHKEDKSIDSYREYILNDYEKRTGKRNFSYQNIWDYHYTWKTDPKYPVIKSGKRKDTVPRLKGKLNRKVSVDKKDQIKQRIEKNKQEYIQAVQRGDNASRARLQKEYNALEHELLEG